MSDHEHRGAGVLVTRAPARTAAEPERAAPRVVANGFAASWARAVRARRPARAPRTFTDAGAVAPPTDAPPRRLAAPPAPPEVVTTGAGSRWLRRPRRG